MLCFEYSLYAMDRKAVFLGLATHSLGTCPPLPTPPHAAGAVELVRACRAAGLKTAVASSAERVKVGDRAGPGNNRHGSRGRHTVLQLHQCFTPRGSSTVCMYIKQQRAIHDSHILSSVHVCLSVCIHASAAGVVPPHICCCCTPRMHAAAVSPGELRHLCKCS